MGLINIRTKSGLKYARGGEVTDVSPNTHHVQV